MKLKTPLWAMVIALLMATGLAFAADPDTQGEVAAQAVYDRFVACRNELYTMVNRGLPTCEALVSENGGQVINSTNVEAAFFQNTAPSSRMTKSATAILKQADSGVTKLDTLESNLP